MALSLLERQSLRDQIETMLEKLDSDKNIPRKERYDIKYQISVLLKQLGEAIAAQPEGTTKPESLLKLEAGEFDGLEPRDFNDEQKILNISPNQLFQSQKKELESKRKIFDNNEQKILVISNNGLSQSFKKDTEELRKIIKQAANTGEFAWKAGEILKKIRDNKSYQANYESFEKYTQKEFSVNPQTANNYIVIYQSFKHEEIGNMLVTYLRVIADIDNNNVRKMVLDGFRKIKEKEEKEKQEKKNNPDINTYFANIKDVIATISLIGTTNETETSKEEISETINSVIEKGKEREENKKKNRGGFGKPFEPKFFQEIRSLIENEPINEAGLVALFCLLFPMIKGRAFNYNGDIIKFEKIKYIQTSFPDACIRYSTISYKKEIHREFTVEFEFVSFNYIRHGHHNMQTTCDMIICWEENAKTDSKFCKNKAVKELPPILSLKNIFETDRIELL